ncbi:MAG: hypothetical protein V9E87_13175 [Gemmatimonadales bacterium]
MDHRLASRGLPRPTLHHVPHDDVVDGLEIDPGPADHVGNGKGAQSRRGKRGQGALITTDRRPAGGDDNGNVLIRHAASRIQDAGEDNG